MKALYLAGLCMASGVVFAQSNTFSDLVPGMLNDHVVLGSGYNSDTQEFFNVQPVKGVESGDFGTPIVTISSNSNGNYEEVLRILNGNVDVTADFPVVKVEAGGHLAKELASTDFSTTFSIIANSTPNLRVLRPIDDNVGYTLTAAGQDLADNHQSRLLEMAGDSFITEIEYNAQVIVNIKVEYLSESHKSEIGGYLNFGYDNNVLDLGIEGELNYIEEDLRNSVQITVRAIQRGGDPLQLLQVIPDNIMTCTLDNYEPCFNMFEQAYQYLNTLTFKNQLVDFSDYNVVRCKAVPYDRSTVAIGRLAASKLPLYSSTKTRIFELEDGFKNSINMEHRASEILSKYSAWMSAAESDQVRAIRDQAYSDAWVYEEYARYCRDNPYERTCIDAWADYLATCSASTVPCLNQPLESDLNVPAESVSKFFDCENARAATTNFGLEQESVTFGFRNLGWAPTFIDPGTTASGLIAWMPCSKSLPTYGSTFTN